MTLYTKPACSLCAKAKSLLNAAQLEFTEVNVLTDDRLMALYQYDIPVLVSSDGRELLKGVFTEARLASIVARG